MDIRELLLHIRAGSSNRQIERDTGVDRRTVKRYRGWAKDQCLLEEPLPPLGDLLALLEQTMPAHCPPQNTSSVEPYRDLVTQLLKENVEIAAIKCRLEERGYTGSYSAVRRFVRKIKPHTPEATVRVERKPGEEAQVDFGYAGRMIDPVTEALRRTWAFVMTLSWSRRKYAITDEDVEQLVTLLERDALLVSGDADVAGTIPEDPTDEMVLACAVDAQADVIVSGDRRLLDMDSYRSIPILTARQFLERLETDSPGSMPSTKSWW